TMQEAIEMATELMDRRISTVAERQAESKRKFEDTTQNNQTQQQNKRQNTGRAYVAGNGDKIPYEGTKPLCPKCNFNQGLPLQEGLSPVEEQELGKWQRCSQGLCSGSCRIEVSQENYEVTLDDILRVVEKEVLQDRIVIRIGHLLRTPNGIRQVFRPCTGYYRRSFEGFSKIAKTYVLAHSKIGSSLRWGDKQEAAFQLLKQKLCSAPILALPEGSEDFIVYCDASIKGLGAVLMQREKLVVSDDWEALSVGYSDKRRCVRACLVIRLLYSLFTMEGNVVADAVEQEKNGKPPVKSSSFSHDY
ncbi:putative reverse transcriptase domain-containing protein, partial [Tanacetum coccineum]